ncbi:GxxExxY protein [Pedobacter sp. Du54]|uniref:GxxExxY protein n=1 Tax=Pedobacter anseongensis TaxID=3133439 RepID=UPI00309B9542
MIDRKFLNVLEYKVTGACIEVHKALGSGLLESIYHNCLKKEFQLRSINFISEKKILINYKDEVLDTKIRADFFIENCLILELKSVERVLPIHEAQVLTYMKILKAPKGLLINFNSMNIIQHGKKPFINEFYDLLKD